MTGLRWKSATPEEKWAAIEQVKSKAYVAATYFGLLALNQGLLTATDSDQKINFTDPFRADFLKFKVAGMNVAYGNPMLTLMRLPIRLYQIRDRGTGKIRNLTYPDERLGTISEEYIRSQLSPFASLAATLYSKGDWQHRPLPTSEWPVPKRLRQQGIEPYTWKEFGVEQVLPIPFEEAAREVWKTGFGATKEQQNELAKAIATLSVMSATGARVTEDVPYSSDIPPTPLP
jgi:hypothetical protein